VARAYATVLADMMGADVTGPDLPADAPAAPATGLLSALPPLTRLRHHVLMDLLREERPWSTSPDGPIEDRLARVRQALYLGARPSLERLLAGEGEAPLPEALVNGEIVAGLLGCALLGLPESSGADELVRRLEAEGRRGPGLDYLAVEALLSSGSADAAWQAWRERAGLRPPGGGAAVRLRQAARVARRCGASADIVSTLRAWLGEHPDDPESGSVWLATAMSALDAKLLDTAAEALLRADTLLGRHPAVVRLEAVLATMVAAEGSA
jgi:hypothetical protein